MMFTWDVTCPHCGAGRNQKCRDRFGDRAKFHVARVRLSTASLKGQS